MSNETVKGCKHLMYNETKMADSCSVAGLGNDNATWERHGPNGFQLCQFCDQRGRLGSPDACISESRAQCRDFEMHEHQVIFRDK